MRAYKWYTRKDHFERLVKDAQTLSVPETSSSVDSDERVTRSKSGPNDACIICGYMKHNNEKAKYRICEKDRAQLFLDASRYFKDEVFLRTAHLVNVEGVFTADLRCHEACIKNYIRNYTKALSKDSNVSTDSKQRCKDILR